jgi:hypothetical protein
VDAFTAAPPGVAELSDEDQATLLRISRSLAAHVDPESAAAIGLHPPPQEPASG